MTNWALIAIWVTLCIMMGPLMRIANALETHNRWQAKMSADLATIRDILNIKRG